MPNQNSVAHALHFSIPRNNSGHGNVLKVGRGISTYWDLQPPNVWPAHVHPTVQIVMVLEPASAVLEWGMPGQVRREAIAIPHVWVVPHDTPHSAEYSSTAATVVFYLERSYVVEEYGAELVEGGVLPLTPLLQQDYLLNRLCQRFHSLCHRREKLSDATALAGATLLTSAMLKIFKNRDASPGDRASGLTPVQLERVVTHIAEHLRESIDRSTLADIADLSECHFARMFKRSTGHAPMQYVRKCRLHRARQLLETGEWKVAAAAADTGFCDQSHLDRQFRREFGCSPGSVIPEIGPG